jgi:putative hemolysin
MRSTMRSAVPEHAWHKLALFRRLRALYGSVQRSGQTPTPQKLLEAAGVRWRVDYAGLGRIPQSGPVLVVANGTLGLRKCLALAAALPVARPDTKVVANYLLGGLPELDPLLVAIDPWAPRPGRPINRAAMRAAVGWLRAGHLLAVFPAGDRIGAAPQPAGWDTVAPRLVRASGARIVPVHIHSVEPGELELRVGDPVEPEGVCSLPPRDAAAYLRWKTQQLALLREPPLRLVPRLYASSPAALRTPA